MSPFEVVLSYDPGNGIQVLKGGNIFGQWPALGDTPRLPRNPDEAVLTLDDGTELAARWVLACDGAESQMRRLAGIGVSRFEYRQHCMLINIDTAFAQEDITWQQFTPSGPRAFLPLPGRHGSLVWYDSPARIRALSAMSNEKLGEEVRRHFPARLGGFTVTAKGVAAGAVERAIAMSHDKYCSASIMLGKTAEITTSFELFEA